MHVPAYACQGSNQECAERGKFPSYFDLCHNGKANITHSE